MKKNTLIHPLWNPRKNFFYALFRTVYVCISIPLCALAWFVSYEKNFSRNPHSVVEWSVVLDPVHKEHWSTTYALIQKQQGVAAAVLWDSQKTLSTLGSSYPLLHGLVEKKDIPSYVYITVDTHIQTPLTNIKASLSRIPGVLHIDTQEEEWSVRKKWHEKLYHFSLTLFYFLLILCAPVYVFISYHEASMHRVSIQALYRYGASSANVFHPYILQSFTHAFWTHLFGWFMASGYLSWRMSHFLWWDNVWFSLFAYNTTTHFLGYVCAICFHRRKI